MSRSSCGCRAAAASGGTAEAIYNELIANLVSRNSHMVPAGIVAVNPRRSAAIRSRRLGRLGTVLRVKRTFRLYFLSLRAF
jgi:hypothetical protein